MDAYITFVNRWTGYTKEYPCTFHYDDWDEEGNLKWTSAKNILLDWYEGDEDEDEIDIDDWTWEWRKSDVVEEDTCTLSREEENKLAMQYEELLQVHGLTR